MTCIFRQGTDESGEVFECDPSIAKKIRQENKKLSSSLSIRKIKGPGFSRAFVKMPFWAKYNKALTATEIYEKRYVKPLPDKGDIYIDLSWETEKTYIFEYLTISDNVNLLVLFININYSDHKRVVCQIESLHQITNSLLPDEKHDQTFGIKVREMLLDERHDRTFGIKCCRTKCMTGLLELSIAGRKA
ncbi:hypothetical protein RclHR1_37830002 [Rhizophagus clarus]|uniref:Uncharacterized protein n=1 Tax=Rhizophagus clarus TaxID=94130 RepID=A0A2Z6RUH3_9GLOM|nr:hypothetical protein RclHR1_37830002 [Rhizophagus clarus]